MIGCFGEIVVDCFPDKEVVGGAPLNVAVHLKRLGVDVDLISAIGDDHHGRMAGQLLEKLQLDTNVSVHPMKPTGVAQIQLNEQGHTFEIARNSAWEQIDVLNPRTYGVLVYGSLAMISEENRVNFEKMRAKSKITQCFCDLNLRAPLYTQETIEWCLERADYLKISDEEALELGRMYGHEGDIPKIIIWLKERWNLKEVYCTCGAKGSISIIEGELFHYPIQPDESLKVIDTVGAGDSFSASLIYSMYFGIDRTEIIAKAHAFAASICTYPGALPANTDIYSVLVGQSQ